MFGINAELIIDHAWGWEPCTIAAIKSYKPESSSISSGQVLQEPYDFDKACVVVMEMADQLALDLVEKQLVTDQLVLNIGYDMTNLADVQRRQSYAGQITTDSYGRQVPRDAHGSINLERQTASSKIIIEAMMNLFERIANPALMIRKITVVANHIMDKNSEAEKSSVT